MLQFLGKAIVTGVAQFLEKCPDLPRLRDLVIEWESWSRKRIVEELSANADEFGAGYQAFETLDQALLRFPHPKLTFVFAGPIDAKTLSFWARELGKHLPMLLAEGGAVTAECKEGEYGHLIRETAKLIVRPSSTCILCPSPPQRSQGSHCLAGLQVDRNSIHGLDYHPLGRH